MTEIINMADNHYYPDDSFNGLEKLILFPGGEQKRNGIPNGSVWVYGANHSYDQRILADDCGCGMTAFFLSNGFDIKKSADKIADYLNGKKILGRGNHFVDICSSFTNTDQSYPDHAMLILHTDGKSFDDSIPTNFEEAQNKTKAAVEFRKELGFALAKLISSKPEILGDWPHNTIEYEDGKFVYRKGTIKVIPEKVHMFPVSLGSTILFYSIHPNDVPELSSVPHAAGRKGPIGEYKVTEEKAKELRKSVYVPDAIPDASLRAAHPDCFNDSGKIYRALGKHMVSLGETKINAYIGKI